MPDIIGTPDTAITGCRAGPVWGTLSGLSSRSQRACDCERSMVAFYCSYGARETTDQTVRSSHAMMAARAAAGCS